MHINDDHMYHGAALTQIADHKEFKAINAFHGIRARGAFQINNNVGIYVKHALKPAKSVHKEFVFTFNQKSLDEIEEIKKRKCDEIFVVLVCVAAADICVLSLERFEQHIENRKKANGGPQDQYQLLVTAAHGASFHVYVNAPKTKGKMIGKQVISRNEFPLAIFSN